MQVTDTVYILINIMQMFFFFFLDRIFSALAMGYRHNYDLNILNNSNSVSFSHHYVSEANWNKLNN